MRISPAFVVIPSGATQTTAIAVGVDTLGIRRRIVSLQKAIESYALPGITKVTSVGRSLMVNYDASQWNHESMRAALVALESTAAFLGETQPSKHFEWPLLRGCEQESDLQLAAVSNGLTTAAFLTRMMRTTYVIDDFRMPGLSPQLSSKNFPHPHTGFISRERRRKASTGAVTLSAEGLSVQTRETMTQDLIIGHVLPDFISLEKTSLRVGDCIRFRPPKRDSRETKQTLQHVH